MDIIEISQDIQNGDDLTVTGICAVMDIFLVLVSVVFNIVLTVAIYDHKEMLIKRNYFILHICLCHIILRFSTFLAPILILSIFGESLIFTIVIFLIDYAHKVKCSLIFCFFVDSIYERLDKNKLMNVLHLWWFLLPIYVVCFLVVIHNTNNLTGFLTIQKYILFAMCVILFTIDIIKCCSFYFNNDKTLDYKIRFFLNSILIITMVLTQILNLTTYRMFFKVVLVEALEGIQMLSILILLLNYDGNFNRALKLSGGCIKNQVKSSLSYNSLERLQ